MLRKISIVFKVLILIVCLLVLFINRNVILERFGLQSLLSGETALDRQKKLVAEGELEVYKDKWGYNYYKNLDEVAENYDRTIFYQRIYKACEDFEKTVSLTDLSVDREDAWRIYTSMRLDNPQLIQTEPGYNYNYYTDNNLCYEFSPNIKNKSDYDFEKLWDDCDKITEVLKAQISDKYGDNPSRLVIVKEIHDFLAKYNEYAESDFDQSMTGLVSKEYSPVCASYALAMKYYCNQFGVQCEVITGDITKGDQLGPHMWNLVNYGEPVDYSDPAAYYNEPMWYEVDLTWDDPVGASEKYVRYDYFNVSTAFMNQSRVRNHLYYAKYPVENCFGSEYSYGNCVKQGIYKKENGKKEK